MKPGWRTTEFWLTAAVIVLGALAAAAERIPFEWAAAVAGACGALYQVSRTLLKLAGKGEATAAGDELRAAVRDEVAVALSRRAAPVNGGGKN